MRRTSATHCKTARVGVRALLALGLLMGVLTAATAAPAAHQATTVTIGGLFTQSGPLAAPGEGNLDGYMFYWQRVAHMKAGSVNVKLVNADDGADPAVGLSKVRALTSQSGAKMIAGTVSSAVAAAVKNYTEANSIPYIISQAATSSITDSGPTAHTVRVAATFRQAMIPFTRWIIRKKHVSTIVYVGSDYSAGHDAGQAVKESAEKYGASVTQSIFAPLGTTDWGPYLAKIQPAAGEAVVVFLGGTDAVNFVRQYQSYGLKGKVPLYGHMGLTNGPVGDAEGAAAGGIITVTEYAPTIKWKQNKAFLTLWRKYMKSEPNAWNVQGYNTAAVIAAALKATNGNTNPDTFGAALHKVTMRAPQGILRFDSRGQAVMPLFVSLTTYAHGKLGQKVLAGLGAIPEQ